MRQSDAAAALAILCGTLIGAQLFEEFDAPPTERAVPEVRVVQVPVGTRTAEDAPRVEAQTPNVTLHVTSADPDREARVRMVLRDYPEGATTEVVTPFTLIATESGIAGTLDVYEGDPDIRAEVEIDGPGVLSAGTISVRGQELWVDSNAFSGGSGLSGGG